MKVFCIFALILFTSRAGAAGTHGSDEAKVKRPPPVLNEGIVLEPAAQPVAARGAKLESIEPNFVRGPAGVKERKGYRLTIQNSAGPFGYNLETVVDDDGILTSSVVLERLLGQVKPEDWNHSKDQKVQNFSAALPQLLEALELYSKSLEGKISQSEMALINAVKKQDHAMAEQVRRSLLHLTGTLELLDQATAKLQRRKRDGQAMTYAELGNLVGAPLDRALLGFDQSRLRVSYPMSLVQHNEKGMVVRTIDSRLMFSPDIKVREANPEASKISTARWLDFIENRKTFQEPTPKSSLMPWESADFAALPKP